ncbi:hypothetical protein DIPPA_62537, partial [Diplonema papillatum]
MGFTERVRLVLFGALVGIALTVFIPRSVTRSEVFEPKTPEQSLSASQVDRPVVSPPVQPPVVSPPVQPAVSQPVLPPVATPGTLRASNCPGDDEWFVPWAKLLTEGASPNGQSPILIDVGANKGYVVADWIRSLWTPRPDFYPKLASGTGRFTDKFCGACCDCMQKSAGLQGVAPLARIIGFEAQPSTVEMLNQVLVPLLPDGSFEVVPKAVGKAVGE